MLKTKAMTKTKILIGGLMIFLVFSSIMLVPVFGDDDEDEDEETDPPEDEDDVNDEDDDDDGIDDDEEDQNEREIHVEVSDNEVQIESKQKLGDVKNKFQIKVKTEDEGLTFKLEYTTDTDDSEFELEFKVKIKEIVEFVDTTADGFYNKSIDTEIQIYELDSFLPIEYTFDNSSGTPIYLLEVSTTDGVFTGSIYFSNEFALVNDTIVAPTQIKIDFGIHSFPYIDANSDLALKVKLETEAEYEEDEETEDEEDGRSSDESEVEIFTGDVTGFFSWVETAIIDGVEHTITATPIEIEDGEQKLYLNYPRGNEIIHDPKIGIANILETPTNPFSIDGYLMATAIGALTIISIVSLAFRRKRK